MEYVALGLRLAIVLVLLTAGIGKVVSHPARRELKIALAATGVPARLVAPTGAGLIAAELAIAVAAVWPPTALASMVLATGLFAVLTGSVSTVAAKPAAASCRCFGFDGGRLGRGHALRNATLTGTAIAGAAATAVWPNVPGEAVGIGLSVGAAAAAAALIVSWDVLTTIVKGRTT